MILSVRAGIAINDFHDESRSTLVYNNAFNQFNSIYLGIGYVILAIASIYCIVWCIRKCRFRYNVYKGFRQRNRTGTINQEHNDTDPIVHHDYHLEPGDENEVDLHVFADRMANPARYGSS